MTIFSVFTLAGGLALFLYGMHLLSAGLEKTAGNKLKQTLESMTSNLFRSIALGAGITMAIQSSSAVTVMLVGFVNSGIMELSQTVGLIMGTNIGTTMTAWILSLTGIESNNFFISLLKPTSFAPLMALAGMMMIMLSKKAKRRNIGEVLLGFAILMIGMDIISGAVKPLAGDPGFISILTYFRNPVLGVATGAIFTGIIQSSSASVGILQALSLTGSVTFGAAIPIIMGQNIGTCVTALIASIGASKNAKRVGTVHILFNVIGTIIFLIVVYGINALFPIALLNETATPVGIAIIHSIFNIASTFILLPFRNQLVKIAKLVVRDNKKSKDGDFDLIDERLLYTPSIAVAECKNVIIKMFQLTRETIEMAVDSLGSYTAALGQKILDSEDLIDTYEDRLGTFLIRLNNDLSDEDRRKIAQMLRAIGDLERISDHACNILESAEEMHDKRIRFSEFAKADLAVLSAAILDILDMTEQAFVDDSIALAEKVEPLEEVIDELKDSILARHIERLQEGLCTIELGFIISNVLTNYERVSDHCSNLATGVVKANDTKMQMDFHGYLHELKGVKTEVYQQQVELYRNTYQLPSRIANLPEKSE